MQNSFERQVQEKMDELQLVPSEPVWQNIEKQIRAKKDRRRFVLWMPVLFLLLGGGVWWIHATQHGNKPGEKALTSLEVARPPASVSTPSDSQTTEGREVKEGSSHSTQMEKTQADATIDPPRTKKNSSDTKAFRVLPVPAAGFVVPEDRWEKTVVESPVRAGDIKVATTTPPGRDGNIQETDMQEIMLLPVRNLPVESEKIASPARFKMDTVVTGSSGLRVAVQPPYKQAAWTWAYTAGIGISGVGKNFGSFGEEKSLMADNLSGSPSGGPGTPSNAPTYKPSPVKNDLSFFFGVSAITKLGRRFSFSAGMQYNYYSTKIAVGQVRHDSVMGNQYLNVSANRYYLNTGTRFDNYHNRYHFISLPLGFDWQVLKAAPLQLQAGIALQQMIATNGLLYDKANNIYYPDKGDLKKTQLFTSLGLSYGLMHKGKIGLYIGPHMQYGITRLEKNDAAKHLFSLGISGRLLFKKK